MFNNFHPLQPTLFISLQPPLPEHNSTSLRVLVDRSRSRNRSCSSWIRMGTGLRWCVSARHISRPIRVFLTMHTTSPPHMVPSCPIPTPHPLRERIRRVKEMSTLTDAHKFTRDHCSLISLKPLNGKARVTKIGSYTTIYFSDRHYTPLYFRNPLFERRDA